MDIFENICRTCGNECLQALSIFEESAMVMENFIPISELISACLPASASLPPLSKVDDYPKQICRICIKKLTTIYEFNMKWVAAHSEFNVALKYEHRRSRQLQQNRQSLASNKTTDKVADENIIPDQLDLKNEPNETVDIIETLNSDSETDEKDNNSGSLGNFQCAFCEETFFTLAAYEVHHKVFHRICEFVLRMPEQSS